MRAIAFAASAVFTLSACTTYVPPAHEPDLLAQRFDSRRLDHPRLPSLVRDGGEAHQVEWNLDAFTRAAIYLNPELEALRARWRPSQAAIDTASRHPNPTLDASAGRATNPPAGEPAGLADLALGFRIETAGKRHHRVSVANDLSESDRLDLHAAAWQLRGKVRDALLDWGAATQEGALLERMVEVDRAIVRMLELRVELGEAAIGEKVRADAMLARAVLDRSLAASRVSEARSRLAQAVGVPVAAIDRVQVRFEDLEARPPGEHGDNLRRRALERDDLRAALARFSAADAAYRLEIAKQYPDIELGPSYSYDTGTNKISFGLMSLTLPVLDRNKGAIAEARARRDEAIARFETLQASTLGKLDHAIAAERDAKQRLMLASAIQRRERTQLDQASRRFAAGEEDRLAFSSAESAAYEADRGAAAARLTLQKSVGELEDAARTPLFASQSRPADTLIENGGSR